MRNSLSEALIKHNDIEEIQINLDLKCLTFNNAEVILNDSATLWLQIEEDSDRFSPTRLLVSLDVDLYSPITRGEFNDNKKLSEINGPKLSSFLTHITEKADGVLMDIDVPSYYKKVSNSTGKLSLPN